MTVLLRTLAEQLAFESDRELAEPDWPAGEERLTCFTHKKWLLDCFTYSCHANPVTKYNWCGECWTPFQVCRCRPATYTGHPDVEVPSSAHLYATGILFHAARGVGGAMTGYSFHFAVRLFDARVGADRRARLAAELMRDARGGLGEITHLDVQRATDLFEELAQVDAKLAGAVSS